MSKNKEEKDSLSNDLKEIRNLHGKENIDPSQYLVDSENDMPEFGNVCLYDYDSDKETTKQEAREIIKSLVDLYLGDAPDIIEHDYLKKRMEEDAEYYGQMKFLQIISERALISQVKLIDNGEFNPRLMESLTKQQIEYRNNAQDGRKARSEIEQLYKSLRKDLNLSETANIKRSEKVEEEEEEEGFIINNAKMNEDLDIFLRSRDKKN